MTLKHKESNPVSFTSNIKISFFIKCITCTLLIISSPASASKQYKVLNDTKGLLSSEQQNLGKNLKSFSSRDGVTVYGNTVQTKINSFLKMYGNDFTKMSNPNNFTLSGGIKSDPMGFINAKYQQSIGGISVAGSYMNISMKGDKVRSVFSSLINDMPNDLKLSPTLDKKNAVIVARNIITKFHSRDISSAKSSEPVLELFNWSTFGDSLKPSHTQLTWYIELSDHALREKVWIDAHSGKLINRINNLHSAKNRVIYDSEDTPTFQNVLVRSENENPTNDIDADSAYDFSGDAYDYFFNEHARDGIDGQGSAIISNVHFCELFECPLFNAFWDGIQLTFGDGLAVDDVVAHELTHGVIENSANLIYQSQSGALNESYADIFGETIDLGNGAGNDSDSQRWFIGEDVPSLGAIRHMSNPGLFGDPETVSDSNFYCGDIFFDNGGVHINSGVPNKAYSLMVDGGTFNGFTVNGIGLDKASKIQYRALSTYLGQTSTFLDNYNSLILSCDDLIGTDGISQQDCTEVETALNAVEMNNPVCFVAPPEPLDSTGYCPQNTRQSTYLSEDFEDLNKGNLSTSTFTTLNMWNGCAGSPDVYCNDEPNNGIYNLTGRDINQVSDSVVTMSSFNVRTDSFLSFDHKYDFETSFDGAVVEYSIDAGATWVDALELYSNGLDYTAVISPSFDNPLADRIAFSGFAQEPDGSYLRTILDLSSLASENIQFRFRVGTDSSVDGFNGWRIDDVLAYQCPSDQSGDILDFLPAILKAAKLRQQ